MPERDEFRSRAVTVTTTSARRVAAAALGMVAILCLGAGCASRSARGPKPDIYPERAHPEADVARAITEAHQSHRRVLLNFGASWCSDSQSMFRLLTEDPVISPLVRARFVLVMIDVGERHGELWDAPIVRQYGSPFSRRGIPALVILDGDGRQLTDVSNHPLRDRDHRRPRKVERFLRAGAGPSPPTGFSSSRLARDRRGAVTRLAGERPRCIRGDGVGLPKPTWDPPRARLPAVGQEKRRQHGRCRLNANLFPGGTWVQRRAGRRRRIHSAIAARPPSAPAAR